MVDIDVPDFFFRGGVKETPQNSEFFFQGGGPGGPGGQQGVNRILGEGGSSRGSFQGVQGVFLRNFKIFPFYFLYLFNQTYDTSKCSEFRARRSRQLKTGGLLVKNKSWSFILWIPCAGYNFATNGATLKYYPSKCSEFFHRQSR